MVKTNDKKIHLFNNIKIQKLYWIDFIKSRFLSRLYSFYSKRDRIDPEYLKNVFRKENGKSIIFTHVGLSDVKQKIGVSDPYSYLINLLTDSYKTIMAPGFTPSFRASGIYSKLFSNPEYGMWSKLFFRDTDHRTSTGKKITKVNHPKKEVLAQ